MQNKPSCPDPRFKTVRPPADGYHTPNIKHETKLNVGTEPAKRCRCAKLINWSSFMKLLKTIFISGIFLSACGGVETTPRQNEAAFPRLPSVPRPRLPNLPLPRDPGVGDHKNPYCCQHQTQFGSIDCIETKQGDSFGIDGQYKALQLCKQTWSQVQVSRGVCSPIVCVQISYKGGSSVGGGINL